jgi:ubiquinone/menaquinone biosynthesis C-methylase UbiE
MGHDSNREKFSKMPLTNFDRYQRIAWAYDFLDLPFEYGRYRKIRPQLFQGLSGRILEAGVGTGRNFPFYPPNSEVVGIDLSPAMLARAERRQSIMRCRLAWPSRPHWRTRAVSPNKLGSSEST